MPYLEHVTLPSSAGWPAPAARATIANGPAHTSSMATSDSEIGVAGDTIHHRGHGTVPLQTISDQLMVEVRREKQERGRLSDDLLSAFQFVFQQPFLQALDLIDRNAVTHFACPSGRELYRVQGSSARVYTCLVSTNHCSCPSFVYTVLVKEDSLMCKHMLAVQLARAMGTAHEVIVTNEEFAQLLGSDALHSSEM